MTTATRKKPPLNPRTIAERESGADSIEAATARLNTAVANLRSQDDWKRWLKWASAFHNYSFNNLLLIASQCPTATRVAGASTWNKLDRHLISGAWWDSPIFIFAPMLVNYTKEEIAKDPTRVGQKKFVGYRIVRVFDIQHTEGKDVPESPKPEMPTGEVPAGALDACKRFIADHGFTFEDRALPPEMYGLTTYPTKTITVDMKQHDSDASTFATFIHEIAHMILHGPAGDREPLSCQAEAEVEAESIAYVVCDHFGINTSGYTFGYVAGWSQRDPHAVVKAGANITRVTKQIIQKFHSYDFTL